MVLNPAHLVSDQEWAEVIQVNLGSAFATVRAAAGALMKGGGSVVLLSAAAAEIGLANHEAIAAAKAGVAGLTRAAAATYSKKGIRVNCVAPGFVRTSLTSQVICGERALKTSESMHALGRLGTPDDIAFAIKWLLSDESSWVTGQVISVDGGLSSVLAR
jgi:NAD(P)-dependent dehydrogenase (short-subunit alcohol dehydrogenase family)